MRYLFGFIFAFNLSVSQAIGSDETPPVQVPETTQDTDSNTKTGNEYAECTVDKANDANLIDDVHIYLNESFCNPAVWFDSFFSDERIDEEVRPGSNLRWQNDYIEDEFGVSKKREGNQCGQPRDLFDTHNLVTLQPQTFERLGRLQTHAPAAENDGRRPRRVDDARVNCETTRTAPPASITLRFMRPVCSGDM